MRLGASAGAALIRPSQSRTQSGQAMILFALLLPILMGILGLVVEGGRVWVEYRRMQSAADLAAMVGAQQLPCNLGDSTCISAASTLACTYAGLNGFSGCTPQGSSSLGRTANVPPLTCSPYDFIDYGNNSLTGTGPCKTSVKAVSNYNYLEVRLDDPLFTIPIFNIPVTLGAHAVARHGVPSTKDFAVSQLDPAGALSTGGSFQWVVNGSTFANGTLSLGGKQADACEGGDFTASSAAASPPPAAGAKVPQTFSGGVVQYAPPTCLNDDNTPATPDPKANWVNSLPQIADPYCSSFSPQYSLNGTPVPSKDCNNNANPYTGQSVPNCPDCSSNGWYYDGTSWHGGGTGAPPDVPSSGANLELFPGVYGSLNLSGGASIHLNPGVYTFTGDVSFDFGAACVFGAPACDSGKAANQCQDHNLTFLPKSAAGNTFYYNCSSYGFWDTKLARPASSSGGSASVPCSAGPTFGPSCTAPTYWDTSLNGGTGGVGGLPLNGVTLNFTSTSTIKGHGAGNSNLAWFLSAPNPCPGTGTTFLKPTDPLGPQVQFNVGNSSAYYIYDSSTSSDQLAVTRYGSGSQSPQDSALVGSPAAAFGSQIYPSLDLTTAGECRNNTQEVWPGEMAGNGQHLHFVIFDRFNNTGTGGNKLNGNEGQSFIGVWYLPKAKIEVTGAGKGAGGVPFITGQIVAWNIDFGGSGAVDLIYRPCNTKEDVCASGLGTQLIQ